ncbi:DUF3182 family protein [Ramlibacter tataouinensis]|uniref:DUF3182 family protein n=1 Tax=Ramlibacter tataouinensis TaxID=94132 RepID=UPI0022F3A26B|nr:DUF3182 family protein [Ramlibacter tataouinensis]WBY01131.1 DUF3182 family protein [Ramlibacter tataouinensis]
MTMAQQARPRGDAARGTVLALVPGGSARTSRHECAALEGHVRVIAGLLGQEPGGWHDPGRHYDLPVYFVPSDTLTLEQAHALGIRGPDALFGGVVPHAFVAGKCISHPLVSTGAACPAGWSHALHAAAADAVLDGHAAFSREDAQAAGRRLLARGPVRIKPAQATGGRGQVVAADEPALVAALGALGAADLQRHGVVLEEDLAEVRTYSVGTIQVGALVASYYGTQQLTPDTRGEPVYGGSKLDVTRGGLDALAAADAPAEARLAVEQARRFDAAVQACYPDFFASRRNYDVAVGRNGRGELRSGVLEQSWRVGGATGAELAALAALAAQPALQRVRARCVERFGPSPEPPPGATVHFRGEDPRAGWLTKYTVVEDDADAS